MKIYGKGVVIVLITIVSIVLFAVIGLNKFDNRFQYFESDGHVIIYTESNANNKYNFNENTRYKTLNDKIVFKDNNDDEKEIQSDSFIHYENGNIGVFKKAVILDFNDLERDTYRYYNVFETQILEKKGTSYEIDYINNKLSFRNFMIKTKDNKYLFVGNEINLSINGETKKFTNSFLEVTFLDGNIVRICNDNYYTQNISSSLIMEMANVKVDFSTQNLNYKNSKKLNLSEVTINKDDNIIIPIDEEKNNNSSNENAGENNGAHNIANNNNSITRHKPTFPEVSSGIIDLDYDNTEEIIEENAKINDAVFKLSDLEIEINSLRAKVDIIDEKNTLVGDINVKVVDSATNSVVYNQTETSGFSNFDIEVSGLIPNNNYVLIVNSDYEKNYVTYNKDFIQKTFITKRLGLNIEKDFVTSNTISVNVEKSNFSNITRTDAILTDNNGTMIRNETLIFDDNRVINLVYNNLNNNSKYFIKLTNYVYSTYQVSNVSDIVYEINTLKSNPQISNISFTIDKTNGSFNMNVGKVIDPDYGVKGYRYEVYDARTYSADATPLSIIERQTATSTTINIDNIKFYRGNPYVFKVIALFDDNEKIVEIESPISDPMIIGGVEFPHIYFDKDLETTYEKITGTLVISDPGNTIMNLQSKSITVTYTNSVGVQKTLTSLGTLRIPINVNNLRAEETYVFSVYASVDLKDNNAPVDNCFIGSAIVKTTKANDLKVLFKQNDKTSRNAFSVAAQLTNYNLNAAYEASTLNGLRFNLYSGTSTNDELISTVTDVDRNMLPYESTLKEKYYDKEFVLTPQFFNKNNGDLYSDNYTIEITNAYDYTDYKNEIGLIDNIITISTNPYFPDYPQDLSNSIESVAIRNADYGNNKRMDLLDDTIVGYKIRALYDNSRKYAKTIHYFMHDASTDEIIKTYDYTVPLNREPEFISFDIKDGIAYNQHDDFPRRGGEYYFSYIVDLDTDNDGIADMSYPAEDEVMLKSTVLYPPKQSPIFMAYPSKMTENKFTLKYYYNDIDMANISYKINVRLKENKIQEIPISNFDNEEFENLDLNIDSGGNLVLSIEQSLSNIYVSDARVSEYVLYRQYLSGIIKQPTSYYTLENESNRLKITFIDYNTNIKFYDGVARYDVIFTDTTTNETIEKNNMVQKDGIIYVDYIELEQFLGHDIKVDVRFYADLGYYGYDLEGDYFALQSLKTNSNDVENYYIVDGDKLHLSQTAYTSFYQYTLNHLTNELLLNSEAFSSGTGKIDLLLDKNGYSYNYDYLAPKKLFEINGSAYANQNIFKFNYVVPGISLTNKSGLFDISATLSEVNFKARLYGISDNKIKDNKIYAMVYELDSVGSSTLYKTVTFNVENFDSMLKIEGLNEDTMYKMIFKADILNSYGAYQSGFLYDMDNGEVGREYIFKTIGAVGVDDLKITYYNPNGDYNDRSLNISYTLTQISGFQSIKYVIERQEINNKGETTYVPLDNLSLPFHESIRTNMSFNVTIPVDCGIFSGKNYRLNIIPIKEAIVDGKKEMYELDAIKKLFTLDDLYRPYIHIKNDFETNLDDVIIKLGVTIRDYSGSIVDNEYKITVKDKNGDDVTPITYSDIPFSTKNTTSLFTISGVSIGEEYTVSVKYYLNQTNNSQDSIYVENVAKVTVRNSYGISTGNIYTRQSTKDSSKVVLQFLDTVRFDQIKQIKYSIYSTSGENLFHENRDLITVQKTLNNSTYYEYEMPVKFVVYDSYYIQLQFLNSDNEIVSEETLIYNYFE